MIFHTIYKFLQDIYSFYRILTLEEVSIIGTNAECNDLNELYKLTPKEQETLIDWVIDNIHSIKGFNDQHTSYSLKHLFESWEKGFYITNGAFKGAMLECEYRVKDKTITNWIFNISQRSLCFRKK